MEEKRVEEDGTEPGISDSSSRVEQLVHSRHGDTHVLPDVQPAVSDLVPEVLEADLRAVRDPVVGERLLVVRQRRGLGLSGCREGEALAVGDELQGVSVVMVRRRLERQQETVRVPE